MKRLCVLLWIMVLLGMVIFLKVSSLRQEDRISGYQINYKWPELPKVKPAVTEKQKDMDDENIAEPTPVYRQLSVHQKVQETSYYCACACVQMTLEMFGTSVSQDDLAKQMHTDPITGSEYVDTVHILNHYLFGKEDASAGEAGYRIQRIDAEESFAAVFEQRFVRNIEDGYPIFATVDLHALYPQLPSANHMVLVIGYVMKKDTLTHYTYIDPYPPVQEKQAQGLKTIRKDIFLQAMALNEEPAYLW